MVRCPKCSAVQEQTTRCKFCGIDFYQGRPNPILQDPVVVETRRFFNKLAGFPDTVKNGFSAQVDRLSRKVGIDIKSAWSSAYRIVSRWCRDVLDLVLTILVCGIFAWVVSVVLM